MKDVRNKLLTSILLIIMIIGIGTLSKAYTIGQTIEIGFGQYASSSNIYCLQHNQRLTNDPMTFKVTSIINIRGNTATDHKGKTIESWYNAKMAGIVGSSRPKFYDKANAMWNFGYTWMEQVGKNFAGLYSGYAANQTNGSSPVDTESTDYANSIQKNQLKLEDKTDKSKIKATSVKYKDVMYVKVGPFNWSFSGDISEVNVQDNNGKNISGLLYVTYAGTTPKVHTEKDIPSDKDFYILVPVDSKTSEISKIKVKKQSTILCAKLVFLRAANEEFQNLMIASPSTDKEEIETELEYDIKLKGNLKVIKVDAEDNEIKLKDVGFIIQRKDDGTYIQKDQKGNINYVKNRDEATEFITDENGSITIEGLLVGTYVAYETKNPNYGYEIIKDGQSKDVLVNKTNGLVIENKQKYIKLSGYVWLDLKYGKDTTLPLNALYKDNEEDINDQLMEGITVRLKDRTTNQIVQDKNGNICETVTDSNGAFLFEDIEIDKLGDYYMEYEYNGLKYENVTPPYIDKANGSKATEGEARTDFNEDFYSIEGNQLTQETLNTGKTTGVAKDIDGNVTHELIYTKNYGNATENPYTAILDENDAFNITSNTDNAAYSIKGNRVIGEAEIKNINLGLLERTQADLSIIKDLTNAKVSINGYEHTYYYEQAMKAKEDAQYGGEGFNVSVKFGTGDINKPYTRAIYPSDVNFTQSEEERAKQDRELKVYITYKIGLVNKSDLEARVNSIIDYYDSRYTLIKAGTSIDEQGNTSDDLTPEDANRKMDSGNQEYSKAIIKTNKTIEKQKTEYIYVQFQLNREAVKDILDMPEDSENKLLENIVEINSYSSFSEGKIYATVDKNSNPGNSIPGVVDTYEDDVDISPALKLETADARKLEGKVFLDSTDGQIHVNEVREGNGTLDEGEIGISGVELTLTETSGSGKVYKDVKTNEDGTFTISDFIPGRYTLMYQWGDNTYKVENYKGTIYNEKDRASTEEWYRTLEPRYSDAMDNWEIRKAIDEETRNGGNRTITKMESTTPVMGLAIEYDAVYTASYGDRYEYKVQNIDFGIVERPRQELKLEKHVKTLKITLPDGQTLIDVTVNEEGKFEGQVSGVTGGPNLGFVKAEIDRELLEGSTAEVIYEIIATNNSELDYYSEDGYYYIYGYKQASADNKLGEIVKIQIGELEDRLSNVLVVNDADPDSNKWTVQTLENGEGRSILTTDEFTNTKLTPTESVNIRLSASRLLSPTDEVEFNNDVKAVKPIVLKYGRSVESPVAEAEPVIIMPPTGENRNYTLPIIIGISALAIIGVGIAIIKKRG